MSEKKLKPYLQAEYDKEYGASIELGLNYTNRFGGNKDNTKPDSNGILREKISPQPNVLNHPADPIVRKNLGFEKIKYDE